MKDKQTLKFFQRRGYLIEKIEKDTFGCKNPDLSVLFVLYFYSDSIEISSCYPVTDYAKANPEIHVLVKRLNAESLVSNFHLDEEEGAIISAAELAKPFMESALDNLMELWENHDSVLPFMLPGSENLVSDALEAKRCHLARFIGALQ